MNITTEKFKTVVIGEPSVISFDSGKSVCNFSVIFDDGIKKMETKDGQDKKTPQAGFIDVVIWNNSKANEQLKKGSNIYLSGNLGFNEYESKEHPGVTIKSVSINANYLDIVG